MEEWYIFALGLVAVFTIYELMSVNTEPERLPVTEDDKIQVERVIPMPSSEVETVIVEDNTLVAFQEAEAMYTEAIHLNPEYSTPWYNRGKARLNLSKYSDAISDFDKALQLCNDAISDLLELGEH